MNESRKPLITVVIPTYRRPKLLRRAIMSALNQTYPYVRVCVYDNASGDETASVVSEIMKKDTRVKYYCHKKNIGGIPNTDYGIRHVNAPFFSFLYDDDVLLPEFFQTAMDELTKFPDAMFFAGLTIYMSDSGMVSGTSPPSGGMDGYFTPPEGLFECLNGHGPALTAILYRKEIIQKTGAFDLNVGAGADSNFVLRIVAHFPIIVSKQPCAIYMIHGESYTASMGSESVWPVGLKMIHNLEADNNLSPDARLLARQLLMEHFKNTLFSTWITSIRAKNFRDAHRITDIFRDEFDQKGRAAFMNAATTLFEHVPATSYIIKALVNIRALLRKNKSRALQDQFGRYAKYLDIHSSV